MLCRLLKIALVILAAHEMTSSTLWDRLGVTAVRASILEAMLARGNCQEKAE